MNLGEDGRNVLTEISQFCGKSHVVEIPTPVPGVPASPSMQVSDSGIASHENLDFVTKQVFQLQMSICRRFFAIPVAHYDCSFCSVKASWRDVKL